MATLIHTRRIQNNQHQDTLGNSRSKDWPEVRRKHLQYNNKCAVCGSSKYLEVHHIKPFHKFPELELEPSNLITLCEGYKNVNCHLVFGHFCNYTLYNTQVREHAKVFNMGIEYNTVIL